MSKTDVKKDYQKEVEKIVAKIKTKYKPEKIIAFGSAASGKIDEDSDVDLLIIKNDKRRFADRIREVSSMFKHTLPVDLLVYTPDEITILKKWDDPFIKTVLSEGKTLHG